MATSGATGKEVTSADHSLLTDVATADSPLFRLPPELRNKIYDLVILSEGDYHHSVALEAGKKPRTTAALVTSGATRACKQLKVEYTAALERFVKKLITKQKSGGIALGGPGAVRAGDHHGWVPRLAIAYTQRGDSGNVPQIRALKIRIPVFDEPCANDTSLFLTFRFPGFGESGPCHCLDILWDEFVGVGERDRFEIPSPLEHSLHQVVDTARAVDWKGSLREYFFWNGYIVRHLPEAYGS